MVEFNPAFEVMHPSKRAIVLVDDEAEYGLNQKLIIMQLEKGCRERGIDLRVYTEPKRAFEFIAGNDRQHIVMMTDNNMPEMTGRELVYALDGLDKLPQTVLYSGLITEVGELPKVIPLFDKTEGRAAVKEVFRRFDDLVKNPKAPDIAKEPPLAKLVR